MIDQNPPRVRWLATVRLDDRPNVGGKGANLGELFHAGSSVPDGFVLTTAAFEGFLASLSARGQIRRQVKLLEKADTATIAQYSGEIRDQIENAALEKPLIREIADAYGRLAGYVADRPVAIRSSATSEDHAEASFAGMQDTILWVQGIDAVIAAIKTCWSSLYSVESLTYRRRLNLDEDDVAIAVVVQDMVDARAAGVMFTRSPVSGDKSVVVIEAVWGLGSALVGGEVTPDRFVINKITGDIKSRDVSRKLIQHRPSVLEKRVVDVAVPDEMQGVTCLSDEEIHELVETAKRIERHYGHPQDIEWAIERRDTAQSRILVLQTRPETVWTNRVKQNDANETGKSSSADFVLRALMNRGT